MPALVEKLEDAVKERATHVVAFLKYEASLANTNIIPIWREAVLKWEADPRVKGVFNPFTPTFCGKFLALLISLSMITNII